MKKHVNHPETCSAEQSVSRISRQNCGCPELRRPELPQNCGCPELRLPNYASRITPNYGSLSLQRIGPDDGGQYRLVGSAIGSEVAAYISVNLDNENLSGEAFDVVEGTTFSVTGSLTGTRFP